MRLRETGRRVCPPALWFAGGLERDSVWEFYGDQLCTVVHRILFEGGSPVTANSTETLSFEKAGDLFLIRVYDGRFEITAAAVSGG